jgi:Spy/CpxP family protein refolding chaperone
MKAHVKVLTPVLILGCIAFVMVLIAQAKPMSDKEHWRCSDGTSSSEHYGNYMMSDNQSGILFPSFLRGINLTKDQHDAIFTLLNVQAPRVREKEKDIHNALKSLHTLIISSQYKEAEARLLTKSLADDLEAMFLIRIQSEHQIYDLLTTDQRKQLENTETNQEYQPICNANGKSKALIHTI